MVLDRALLCGRSTSPLDGCMNAQAPTTLRLKTPLLAVVALYLLGSEFVVVVLRSIIMKDWSHPIGAMLWLTPLVVLCSLWFYGLTRRLKWVWWTTVILGVIGCAFAPTSVAVLHRLVNLVLYWVQFALTVVSVVVLLLPSVRHWYLRGAAV